MTHYQRKFQRKSARTQIYRALYGEGGRSFNIPWLDDSRRLQQGWNAADIRETLDSHWELARFSPDVAQRLRARLTQLEETKR